MRALARVVLTSLSQSFVGVWLRGGDDLDRVAALQLVAQRHELAVHARAGAVPPTSEWMR